MSLTKRVQVEIRVLDDPTVSRLRELASGQAVTESAAASISFLAQVALDLNDCLYGMPSLIEQVEKARRR